MALATRVWNHDECRRIACYICEAAWAERYVGVVLCDGREFLGSICPKCLRGTPSDAAVWIGEYCLRLRQAIDDVNDALESPPDVPPFPADFTDYHSEIRKITETTARLRRVSILLQVGKSELPTQLNHIRTDPSRTWNESKRLIAEARKHLGHKLAELDAPIAPQVAESIDHETSRVRSLLVLAEELAVLDRWPTTVDEAIKAERAQFSLRIPNLNDDDLFCIVDSRYHAFLSLAG